ncbi:MAG: hypothetical protein IPJ49_11610 [Candidatus Obscuribacter sp.]|nr:hypothetical protein [Candidatus Obscuribacter sp.]
MRRAKIALFAGILSLVMADLSQTVAYGQNVSTLDTLWSRLNLGNLQNLLDTNDASEAELMLKPPLPAPLPRVGRVTLMSCSSHWSYLGSTVCNRGMVS